MAIDFSGSGQYITTNNTLGSSIDVSAYSMFAAFNADSLTADHTVMMSAAAISSGQSSGSIQVSDVSTVDRANIRQRFSDGEASWYVNDVTISVGTAYYVAFTMDKSSAGNNPTVWINGAKKTVGSGLTEDITRSGTEFTGIDSMAIAVNVGLANLWNGKISECAVWATALTDGQMEALSNGFSPRCFPVSLEFYMDLHDTTTERMQGVTMSVTGSPTNADHPRVIYPSLQPVWPQNAFKSSISHYAYPHRNFG